MRSGFRSEAGRETAREICAVLATVMVLSSLPAVGVVFVRVAGAPCFTLNICHPLQSAIPASDNLPLARPAALASEIAITAFPAPPASVKPLAARFLPKPDPPPPKLSA
jgi:hypothetical protein